MKILVCLVSICTAFTCLAQNKVADSTVSIYPFFKKGDRLNYRIVKTSELIPKSGNKKYNYLGEFQASVEILNDTLDYHIVRWRMEKLYTRQQNMEYQDVLANMQDGLTVIYLIHRSGHSVAILNYEAVEKTLKARYDALVKNKKFDLFNTQMLRQHTVFLQSAPSVKDVFLKHIYLYHAPYGRSWKLNDPEYAPDTSANMLGGAGIPVTLIFELTKLNPGKDHMQLTIERIADPRLAAKSIAVPVKAMLKDIRGERFSDHKIGKGEMVINDYYEYDFSISTGWLKSAGLERFGKDGKTTHTERIEMYLLEK